MTYYLGVCLHVVIIHKRNLEVAQELIAVS